MRRNRVLFLLMFAAVLRCGAAEIHVSLSGNDENVGSAASPFLTLTRARDAVRDLKASGGLPDDGVVIYLHGGRYPILESFALTSEDSGEAGRPIVYSAVSGEDARLFGGRDLPAEAFRAVDESAGADRLREEARGKVLWADLHFLGISDLGEYPMAFREPPDVPELFFNDARMAPARWPNDDWAEVAEVVESGPAPWRNHASDQPGTFRYDGDRPAGWTKAPGVWLQGYWCFDWCDETIKVKSIDTAKREITFVQPHCYGLGSGNSAARRYFAVNLLEELDRPGEYCIDFENARLYFWPPEPLKDAHVVLSTLKKPVIAMEGVSYVSIRGLTVEACAGNAIEVKGGREVRTQDCVVRNTGKDAIVVEEGERHSVTGCDLHDSGTAGIRMKGGDRKTLTPCGHEIVYNHIHHVSRRQRTHAYCVHIGGVGVRVANNLLHDVPHQSIGLAGNDHVIEYNEIHHTGMETDDCGSFYMGRNPSERGSVIRYNYWHDIGSAFTHGSCAIYFDDGSGGQTVFGNVFFNAAGGNFGAVFVHGGHDNVADNNVFVDCKAAIRQATWDDAYWKETLEGDLWQNVLLRDVDITAPPYIDKYPELKDFMVPGSRPRMNKAFRNVAVKCGLFIEGNWEEKDNFVTDQDPGFVDMAKFDFRLRDDSVVFEKIPGFEKIPFDKIGLLSGK